jgi:hypothetical protein
MKHRPITCKSRPHSIYPTLHLFLNPVHSISSYVLDQPYVTLDQEHLFSVDVYRILLWITTANLKSYLHACEANLDPLEDIDSIR